MILLPEFSAFSLVIVVEVVVVVAEDIDLSAVCYSISVDSDLSRVVRIDSESWTEEVEFDLL